MEFIERPAKKIHYYDFSFFLIINFHLKGRYVFFLVLYQQEHRPKQTSTSAAFVADMLSA